MQPNFNSLGLSEHFSKFVYRNFILKSCIHVVHWNITVFGPPYNIVHCDKQTVLIYLVVIIFK